MLSVKNTSPDWQEECLDLAQAGQDFVVEGFSEVNLPFFRDLCRRWQYRHFLIERGILFIPAYGKSFPRPQTPCVGRLKRFFLRIQCGAPLFQAWSRESAPVLPPSDKTR